jgi:hypothetical protein
VSERGGGSCFCVFVCVGFVFFFGLGWVWFGLVWSPFRAFEEDTIWCVSGGTVAVVWGGISKQLVSVVDGWTHACMHYLYAD